MKNTLEVISSRITEAEQISELGDRGVEISATKQNKEKRMKKKNENSIRDICDNIKYTNICITGVLDEEEREKGPEKIFK